MTGVVCPKALVKTGARSKLVQPLCGIASDAAGRIGVP
jgi:hypothetical protein